MTYQNGSGYGYQQAPQQRGLAVVAHVTGLLGNITTVGWLGFVGPLVVWLLTKNTDPWARSQAAGAFNFNLSMWILNAIAWASITLWFLVIPIFISVILWVVVFVMVLWCHIKAAVRASSGRDYRYPWQLPILR